MLMSEKETFHVFSLDEKNRVAEKEYFFSAVTQYVLLIVQPAIITFQVPKLLSGPGSFAKFHSSYEKLPEISWVDSLSGKLKGPFFHQQKDGCLVILHKSSQLFNNYQRLFYGSGVYITIQFNKNEGECKKIAELSGGTWFDPFDNQNVKFDLRTD